MTKKYKPYIWSVIIALCVGGLSAVLTKDNMNIYEFINKPPFSPPTWLFPVVWSILFILMGIGSATVYVENKQWTRDALWIYGMQLVVNFFWSIIFFNMQAFLFAFVWLAVLWVLIVWMIISFGKVNVLAAYLQIPYLLWVTFAGYLTLMTYILNG